MAKISGLKLPSLPTGEDTVWSISYAFQGKEERIVVTLGRPGLELTESGETVYSICMNREEASRMAEHITMALDGSMKWDMEIIPDGGKHVKA